VWSSPTADLPMATKSPIYGFVHGGKSSIAGAVGL
jgi:hypothetical protein